MAADFFLGDDFSPQDPPLYEDCFITDYTAPDDCYACPTVNDSLPFPDKNVKSEPDVSPVTFKPAVVGSYYLVKDGDNSRRVFVRPANGTGSVQLLVHAGASRDKLADTLPPSPPSSDSSFSYSPQQSSSDGLCNSLEKNNQSLDNRCLVRTLERSKPYCRSVRNKKGKKGSEINDIAMQQHLISKGECNSSFLTDEELKGLAEEGVVLDVGVFLNSTQKHTLKMVRRKILNKVSANESRKKHREYVDELETRVTQVHSENVNLRSQVQRLESNNQSLLQQLVSLKRMIKTGSRHVSETGVCLMMLTCLFAVCLPCLPMSHSIYFGGSNQSSVDMASQQHSVVSLSDFEQKPPGRTLLSVPAEPDEYCDNEYFIDFVESHQIGTSKLDEHDDQPDTNEEIDTDFEVLTNMSDIYQQDTTNDDDKNNILFDCAVGFDPNDKMTAYVCDMLSSNDYQSRNDSNKFVDVDNVELCYSLCFDNVLLLEGGINVQESFESTG